MNKLVRELEDEFAGEIATACSPYRPEAKDCDGLEEVLQDEKLCKRITIVTTVFYSGFLLKLILVVVIPNIILWFCFRRRKEFLEVKRILLSYLKRD